MAQASVKTKAPKGPRNNSQTLPLIWILAANAAKSGVTKFSKLFSWKRRNKVDPAAAPVTTEHEKPASSASHKYSVEFTTAVSAFEEAAREGLKGGELKEVEASLNEVADAVIAILAIESGAHESKLIALFREAVDDEYDPDELLIELASLHASLTNALAPALTRAPSAKDKADGTDGKNKAAVKDEMVAKGGDSNPGAVSEETTATAKPGANWASMLSIVAIAATVVALLFLIFAPSGIGGADVPTVLSQAPEVPSLTPVDLIGSSSFTWVQFALMLGSILLAVVVLGDRIKSNEKVDFIAMVVCILSNSVLYLLIGYVLQYALEHLPSGYPIVVPIGTAKWIGAAIVQIFVVPIILFLAIKSGRKDYSILGGYWGVTAVISVLFSSLGAFQVLWFVPASSVLPLKQVWTLFTLKMFPVLLLSALTFARIIMAIAVHLAEAVKDWPSLQGNVLEGLKVVVWRSMRIFGGPFLFTLGHVKSWDVANVYLLAIIVSLVLGFLDIRVSSATAKPDGDTPISEGQGLLGLPAKFPFDSWAAQILFVIFYIAGTGHL